MMKTLKLLTFSLITLTLAACSSQPDYRAAEGSGYGYNATQLTDTQYRVTFKARGSDADKAMDYALLRAAEVTLQNGYDWFIVTHRETLVDNQRVEPSSALRYNDSRDVVTRCGLVSCTTTSYPRSSFSAGVHIGGDKSQDIKSILEIKLGKGVRPDTDASFDALEVRQHLSPEEG
ncbi:CC0125/CC1285 family lipoprotein [Pseudidiomarina sp.]|uniref:CC0125/CC1285 family lipoprotein n=1 Tax=Pseudidiomarina sp. TaxID=2081707 RepID=UPI003A96B67C